MLPTVHTDLGAVAVHAATSSKLAALDDTAEKVPTEPAHGSQESKTDSSTIVSTQVVDGDAAELAKQLQETEHLLEEAAAEVGTIIERAFIIAAGKVPGMHDFVRSLQRLSTLATMLSALFAKVVSKSEALEGAKVALAANVEELAAAKGELAVIKVRLPFF